ncbi:MAG: hypothetical protein ABSF29_14130 [Tepidisphaeraceae bacterium]
MDPTTRWMFIVLAMLTIAYAVLRPMFRRKDPLSKPPAFASLSQQRSVERQMQNVLVELADMSRQISAQLDTRAAKLESLIKEADQKLAALKSATEGETGTVEKPTAEMREAEPVGAAEAQHAQIYALSDQGRSPREIAQELNRPSGEIELILALRH